MGTDARRFDLDGVEHHLVDVAGVRLHVVTAGSGSPILLLHGFPQSSWEYRDVIGPLAAHHRVICPDLRGAGESDAPASGYDANSLQADLVGILDHFEVTRVGIAAHDWSAVLAFEFVLDHPDRVDWLLAMAVPHPWTHMSARMAWGFRHSWYLPVLLTPGFGPWLLGAGRQRLSRHLFRGFAADPSAWSEAGMAPYLALLREPARQQAIHRLCVDYLASSIMVILRRRRAGQVMPCPTLLLTGALDPVVRAELLRGPATKAAGVEVEEVPGASHWIVDERPDVVITRALALGEGRKPIGP